MKEKRKIVRRQEREGMIKKHVSLRPSTVAQLEQFAEKHQLSFSDAIDRLAIQSCQQQGGRVGV